MPSLDVNRSGDVEEGLRRGKAIHEAFFLLQFLSAVAEDVMGLNVYLVPRISRYVPHGSGNVMFRMVLVMNSYM